MKKILIACLIVLAGAVCNAEPIPTQDFSSADTPYYMDSDNVLKEKPDRSEKDIDNNENNQADNGIDYGDDPPEDTENSSENSAQGIDYGDDPPTDTDNPINYDASRENINDKNFKPAERIIPQEETQTVDKKQSKKEKKPKKQKKGDKNNPPEQNVNNVEQDTNGDMSQDAIETEEAPTKPKTYSQDDYEQMYRDMPVPTFTFVHGVDPDQYYDMKDTTWSPYPLLRLNAPLYFKTIVIQPGYYLLTPRKYKDDWYILFKEAGAVKYTIPVFAKDFTPEFYYRDNLPELDMGKSQRWQIKFLNAWGKYVRSSKRKPETKTNVELTDLDNSFLLIELYYGAHKYSTIFRTEKF